MTKLEEAIEYVSAMTCGENISKSGINLALKRLYDAAKSEQISLLDYYMAHAPEEPQDWFSPAIPPMPEPISDPDNDHITLNREELIKWRFEFNKQRLLQWPRAWAEEMLKQRGK